MGIIMMVAGAAMAVIGLILLVYYLVLTKGTMKRLKNDLNKEYQGYLR